MKLTIISIITAFTVLTLTALVCLGGRTSLRFSRLIPRNRLAGVLLGAVVLCWSAYEGAAMLPAAFTPWCWAAVPAVLLLCHFFLDFTAARALGGLLILLTNFMIQSCFAANVSCRPLFGFAALLWGLLGTCLVAWPWWLRDGLDFFCTARPPWMKWCAWSAGILSAAIFIILPLL